MCLKLKALGLALFAVMAMGALSASAASAGNFHSEASTHTVIKGSQVGTDKFTVNAGTVTCNEATYAGVQSGATATTVKVTPTYTQCTAFGFVSTTVDTNGCTYELSGDDTHIVLACPNSGIAVTAFNCHLTIPSQVLTGARFLNRGLGTLGKILLVIEIAKFVYTQASKSFPGCSSGAFSNGTYVAEAELAGSTTSGSQVGVWRE